MREDAVEVGKQFRPAPTGDAAALLGLADEVPDLAIDRCPERLGSGLERSLHQDLMRSREP